MVVQRHLLDIAAAAAMMVNDRHPVAGLQQRFGFHAGGPVGVHHHQQRTRLHPQKRIAAADKNILVFRQRAQLAQNRLGGIVLRVHDDLYALTFLAGNAADPCRRA